MKTTIALLCLLGAALTAPAQVNYYRAQQQAIRANNQNNAEQQRIQGETGNQNNSPAPAPGNAAPMDPALQATLSNVTSLQANFAALVNTSDKPEAALKVSLLNNLSQAAQGTKASAASVKKLAEDLTTATVGQKKLAAAQQSKLAREVHALFNSAHLSAAQQEKLLADVQKMLTDAGASVDDAVNVVTDLKAVASETK